MRKSIVRSVSLDLQGVTTDVTVANKRRAVLPSSRQPLSVSKSNIMCLQTVFHELR
jgi:hypothetical protein